MNFPKKFIKATKEFADFDKHVPSPYFRKVFSSEKEAEAEVVITACGFYKLYCNGKSVTKGYFAPYISNPDDIVYYDKYTVTLNKGRNVLAIQLGNGFQNNPGGHIWDFDRSVFRGAPKLALELTYKQDGETVTVVSDESFKTAPSAVLFDDYRFGEYCDARKELAGWNTAEFDDFDWCFAIPVDTPKGEPRLCESSPIIAGEERRAVKIIPTGNSYIYDFGVNDTGICRLTVNGSAGQKIEIQHAEQIIDGRLDVASIWFVREHWERDKDIVHKDTYICRGGEESYTPSFTYHGFRYAEVTGITEEQATVDLLEFIPLHSDIKVCGGFATSDKTVQALQDITVRSDISNFHYFPTDCPHREKNGWTADAALSAEQMLLNLTVHKEYREWMRNIVKAQNKDGALPGIVPTSGWGFEWGNGPAWDSVLIYLPYFTYIYRQNLSIVTESAEAIYRYLQYIKGRRDENGLLAIGLGDWCHAGLDTPKSPLIVTDSIISMDLAKKAEFLFGVAGLPEKAEFAKELAAEFKVAVRKSLVDFESMTVNGSCQTSQAMALFYGVFGEEERPKAFEKLLALIEEQERHIDVGVLGARVLFHVLSDFGYDDLALYMIARPEFPSYGNWLERGATTLWEAMREEETGYSKNHHFWGDISAWFIKRIAGIRYNLDGKDAKKVKISPAFPEELKDASAYFDSNFGRIKTSWKRDDKGILLTAAIPDGMHGEIALPSGYCFTDGTAVKPAVTGEYLIIG